MLGFAILLSGCSGKAPAASNRAGPTADSSQNIVVAGDLSVDTLDQWTLEAQPIFDVGRATGESDEMFTAISYVGRSERTGEVLVVDEAPPFRIFDSTGRLVRRFGGRGEGPGEFKALTAVGLDNTDSIRAFDRTLLRFSVFGWEGKPARQYSPRERIGLEWIATLGPSWIAKERSRKSPSGYWRDTSGLVILSGDGFRVLTLGRFAGAELFTADDLLGNVPFHKKLSFAVSDSFAYVGTGDRYEIEVYHLSGRRRRVIRWNREPTPVTPDLIAKKKAELAAVPLTDPSLRVTLENWLARVDWPKTLPAFETFMVDRAGNLWVQDYPSAREWSPKGSRSSDAPWTVFDSTGTIIARARFDVAGGFDVTDLGKNHVAGVWRDTLDVPHARVYRIRRQKAKSSGNR